MRIFITIACFFSIFYAVAQSRDSLETAFKNAKHDTARCNILNLMIGTAEEESERVMRLNQLIKLAESNIARPEVPKREKNIYLMHVSASLNDLGYIDQEKGNYAKAIEYYEKSLKISEDIDDKMGAASTLLNIGAVESYRGNNSLALSAYNKALNLFQTGNNKKGAAIALNNIGSMYKDQGEITKALNYLERSLKLKEEVGDQRGIARSTYNLADVYFNQNDTAKAMEYYSRSLRLHEKINDKMGAAYSLLGIALIYYKQNNVSKTLEVQKKALKILEEIGDKMGIASALNNIGGVYSDSGDMETAIDYLNRSLKIREEIGDKSGMSNTFNQLGNAYLKLKKYDRALEYSLRSLELAKELGFPVRIKHAAKVLYDIYKEKRNYPEALASFELYTTMKDSVLNMETRKAAYKNQLQHDFEKKEAVLKEQQDKERILAEQKSKEERFVTWLVVVGLVLVLLFSAVIFNRLRITRNQKLLIEKQKREVEEQKELIDRKNSENELLLGEIHHRVKNNLQVISSLLSLQERSMESGNAKSAILEGKERVKSMELVHKMLYQGNSFSGIEMKDYTNNLSHGLAESFGLNKKEVEIQTSFKPITLDVDTAIPLGLILNELIVNSFKYAKTENQKLVLKIEMQEEATKQFKVRIEDNGKGKISQIETSNSFGLKIIRALVRQLDGTMEIEEANGLKFLMSFKNYKIIA